ncbi:hypothetical protein [Ornithinimicrobium sufpigmenti]|uniref:hypothetical protein n=1 Tax=Ornithinimicrobium sufpigmenti TaxID=2508882 RepID=UPI00103604EC|nr:MULTISPECIES: hypothetical protein [unclassified Ornithinimicrobium]
MRILAIDPGNTESGWCVIDADTGEPLEFGKTENRELYRKISAGVHTFDRTVIEMVASYGMPVGKEVFETCVWIGRYASLVEDLRGEDVQLVYRQPVKLHHCHSSKAKDSNVRQALVDRFAPGQPNHGKGTKSQPGWFYGFRADIWQAYALAVYAADTLANVESTARACGDRMVGAGSGVTS